VESPNVAVDGQGNIVSNDNNSNRYCHGEAIITPSHDKREQWSIKTRVGLYIALLL